MAELTPASIVKTLTDIHRRLDQKAEEVEKLDAEHVALRAEHRREFARAFLTAQGSNDVRRYTAEANTAELFARMEGAEQVLRAGKESLRVLRDQMDIARSLSSIMKMEWGQS